MKKLLGTVAIVSLIGCHPALAHDSQDHYKSVTKRIPTTYQSCEVVDVPIYGQAGGGASGADVLTGIIIGGLLGKGASGNDKGAAAGAVIGGMVAADKKQGNQQIIGYRQQQVCRDVTTYDESSHTVYSHSTVTFTHEGRTYTLRFQK